MLWREKGTADNSADKSSLPTARHAFFFGWTGNVVFQIDDCTVLLLFVSTSIVLYYFCINYNSISISSVHL
jgi:hypothetical protein